MIRLDFRKEDFQDEKQLINIANQILYYQMNLGEYGVKEKVEKDLNLYKGILPADKSGKYSFSYAKPLCDDATDTFIGETPDIETRKSSKIEKRRISIFSQKLAKRNFDGEIYRTGHYASKCGAGYLNLYHDIGDNFTSFRALDPLFTNVVYDCSVAMKPLCGFTIVPIAEMAGEDKKATVKYHLYIYDEKYIYAFETSSGSSWTSPVAVNSYFFNCFMVNYWNVKTSEETKKETYKIEHQYKGIPIVEFPNNFERESDVCAVRDLIFLYNKIQNNRHANVEDVLNYVLMVKNVRVGNKEEQKEFTKLLRDDRILPLEGEHADAKFLSNPLNQNELQTLADSVKKDIHYISRIPDLSSVDFSQNASDPIIKIKTKPLLDLCLDKEKFFTAPYLEVLRLTLEFAKDFDSDFDKYDFDLDDVTLKYSHVLPSNDVDAVNMAVNLANAGMAYPRMLLHNVKSIGNVDDYITGMEEYNDYVDKRKENGENKINNGVNETNLERQNNVVKDRKQLDNIKNATNGSSKDISDNKVV